ncbi:MAG: type II toxin-antitoxin system RelE/ParE family toxin [Gemmatimonadales bacterium]
MTTRSIQWAGSSLRDIRAFPDDARRLLGQELRRLQLGLDPIHWRPMQTVGTGVREIRVRTGRAYRLIYWTEDREAMHVLHVFEKRSPKTSGLDLELARARLRHLRGHQTGRA